MSIRRRLIQDCSGVAALEMALVTPFLLTILLGIMEFGLMMYSYNTALNTAREAARSLATGRASIAQATPKAQGELPSWISSKASIDIQQSAPSDPSTNIYTVKISFLAKDAAISNFLSSAFGTTALYASASFQQEYGL